MGSQRGLVAHDSHAPSVPADFTARWRAFEQDAAEVAISWAQQLRTGLRAEFYKFTVTSSETAEAELDRNLPRGRTIGIYMLDLAPEIVGQTMAAFADVPDYPLTPKLVDDTRTGPCLYVGKCAGKQASVRSRLREHFLWDDKKRKSTTSLRLCWWLPSDCWPVHVSVVLLKPTRPLEEISKNLVGFLEDFMWDTQQPLLGRRGGN